MKSKLIASLLCGVAFIAASVFAANEPVSDKPTITIDKCPNIPPGENGSGPISGKVTGVKSGECKVVIYAFGAPTWWVQPTTDEKLTDIEKDSSWANTTHGGTQYAALLVKTGYTPADTLKSLPKEGGDVLAIVKQKPNKD